VVHFGTVWTVHFTEPGRYNKSARLGLVTYVIVRSGPADLGQWITVTRNVREDWKRLYGEEPRKPVEVVSIGIDSRCPRPERRSGISGTSTSRSS
jgi:hypothetical protein